MLLNRRYPVLALSLLTLATLGMAGCANPGPPRSPSLRLPAFVKDLAATRHGDVVDLQFTVPQSTTDGLPLRLVTVRARFCQAIDTGACVPVAELPEQNFAITAPGQPHQPNLVVVHDTLPAALTSGEPRVLTYHVELFNDVSRTGGFSEAAYTAGGGTPTPVAELHAQGSRLGVVLNWKPSSLPLAEDGVVVLRREALAPKPKPATAHKVPPPPAKPTPGKSAKTHAKPAEPKPAKVKSDADSNIVWLTTAPQPDPLAGDSTDKEAAPPALPSRDGITLDDTALAEEPYRYTAERRRSVLIGGRTLELRSETSAPIEFTLHDIYPPPAPTDLSAASFLNPTLTIDLIWQPVDTPHLAGYNVYRETLDSNGVHSGARSRLNQAPVPTPAFHDTTAIAGQHYRYSVTAVDIKGNESESAITTLDPDAS